MGTEPEDLPGPEVDLGFTACNLNIQLGATGIRKYRSSVNARSECVRVGLVKGKARLTTSISNHACRYQAKLMKDKTATPY